MCLIAYFAVAAGDNIPFPSKQQQYCMYTAFDRISVCYQCLFRPRSLQLRILVIKATHYQGILIRAAPDRPSG
jgi:hypothetical protein